jgi:hypothetical protein
MIERITKNEERLDRISLNIKKLEKAFDEFKSNKKDLYLLNKYYGSKNWFKDKKSYEEEKTPRIKAGVLSEDAVWNMNEDITDLMKEMTKIVENK